MTRIDTSNNVEEGVLRREGSTRRSLRSLRCQSVVITEKERSLLIKQSDKKMTPGASHEGKVAASKGFVRSMCKFYSDIIGGEKGERRRSLLDRSASFSAVKDGVNINSLESISEKVSSDQCLASPVSSRSGSGSFRLNRSRSWRGSRLETYAESDTPKRNSPTGQSVRSQDSGFSDSGEHIHHDIDGSYESQSSGPTSGSEEDSKSFVTKINIEDVSNPISSQDHFLYRSSAAPISENNYQEQSVSSSRGRTGTTPVARQKVTGSLDNILSLQEGFKIKLETEPRSLYNSQTGNGDNFHHPINHHQQPQLLLRTKPRVQAQSNLDYDQTLSPSNASCPRFSTPVRASFRRRPQTMICLDEVQVQSPVKRESRTRLKEIKSRRRWSNIDQDQSKIAPLSVNTSGGPINVKNTSNSSQYSSRNNFNMEPCYEFRNQGERNLNLSPSMTALGLISPVETCFQKNISSTPDKNISSQSFNVDGTGTRLMIESYIGQSPAATCRSINTIFPNESVLAGLHSDTIIEHETGNGNSSGTALQQYCSGLQDQGASAAVSNQSLSNR